MRGWSLTTCLLLVACSLDRAPTGAAAQKDAGTASPGGAASNGASGASGASGNGLGLGTGNAGSTGGNAGTNATVRDAAVADAEAFVGDASADAGPQGYEPGAVGAPCTSDGDCRLDGTKRTCFTETSFAPLLTLPGGYCGNLCDLGTSPPACEAGAVCITFPTLPPVLACMRVCSSDGDCREQAGYSCNKPFTSNSSVCSLRN